MRRMIFMLGLVAGGNWGQAEAVLELGPYLVEARHFDGLAIKIPAGVLRLEGDAIERSGAASVPELLEKLAGVRFRSFTGNGTEGQLAMRGFGDNSGLRVLVLVDGQVYNAPDMGGINWAGIDVEELEVVEVLRGGQSVLYGNHAVSGVIKLRTRRPAESLEGRISAILGTEGQERFSVGLGSLAGRVALRAGGHWQESDGYRDNSASESRSGYLGWGLASKTGSEWSGRLTLDQSELQFPGPLSYEQMQSDPRQSNNDGEDRSRTDQWQATVSGAGEWSGMQWQVNGGILGRDRDWSLSGVLAGNRQLRGTLSPRVKFGDDGRSFIFGADLARDELEHRDHTSDTEQPILRAHADLERNTAGAYAFMSTKLGESLELSGGIRLENARTDNTYVRYREEQLRPVLETNRGTYPNPNYKYPPDVDGELSFAGPVEKSGWAAEISLVSKLRQGLHLWTGWDRVYRYPALDETAAYQGYPLSNPLNTDLDPETGNNFEAGAKLLGDNWHLSLTAFHLLMDDEIAYDDDGDEPQNRNIGDTRRTGLELDVTWQGIHYGGSLWTSILRAEFRDPEVGLKIPLVPEFEGGILVWWKPAPEWRLQTQFRYLSRQYRGNDFANEFQGISGYGLLDLTLRWEPRPSMSFLLTVNNLTDRSYAVSAYSGGYYPGTGRTVQGRIRFAF